MVAIRLVQGQDTAGHCGRCTQQVGETATLAVAAAIPLRLVEVSIR